MIKLTTIAGMTLAALALTCVSARADCDPECGEGQTCRYHSESDTFTCEKTKGSDDFKRKLGGKLGGKMDPMSPGGNKGARAPREGTIGK